MQNSDSPSPKDSPPDLPDDLPPSREVETTAALSAVAALAAIKASPQIAAEFSRELMKQKGFSSIFTRRQKGPYYNAFRAMELKPILDDMMRTAKPKLFYTRNFKVNLNTLRNRIYQSFQFLAEDSKMQEQFGSTYTDMFANTMVYRENSGSEEECVAIRFVSDRFTPLEPLIASTGPEKRELNDWKQKVDNYLEDPKQTEPFNLKGLALSSEEVERLDITLGQLEGILANVSNTSINIIKFKEEEPK